jgi:hypothetical protein
MSDFLPILKSASALVAVRGTKWRQELNCQRNKRNWPLSEQLTALVCRALDYNLSPSQRAGNSGEKRLRSLRVALLELRITWLCVTWSKTIIIYFRDGKKYGVFMFHVQNVHPPTPHTHTHTHTQITLRSRFLFEKLVASQLIKKFPVFHRNRMFISVFSKARRWFPYWSILIQKMAVLWIAAHVV